MREQAGSPESDEVALNFLEMLDDGFAVKPLGPGPEDPGFRPIPWRSLSHVQSVEAMTLPDWEWLGIREGASSREAREALSVFRNCPEYVLADEHLSMLQSSANSSIPLLRVRPDVQRRPSAFTPPLRGLGRGIPLGPSDFARLRPDDGGGGGGDGGEKKKPPPPLPGPDYAKLADQILTFIKAIGECLANGTWSIQWAWVYPLGVRVCLDAVCAEKVLNALKALGATSVVNIISLIGTLVAKGLLTWSAIFSALGWVGLAILHFAAYWIPMIALNATPRGVCIVHLFPWNMGLSAGLINGWAEGR